MLGHIILFITILTSKLILERRDMRIGEIQIVRQFRVLAGHGGNALHTGYDTFLLTIAAHLQVLFLHVPLLRLQYEAGDLEVGEASTFHLEQQFIGKFLKLVIFLQLMLQVNDVLQTLQEPHVDFGQLFDTLDAISLFQRLCNGKDTQVGGVL